MEVGPISQSQYHEVGAVSVKGKMLNNAMCEVRWGRAVKYDNNITIGKIKW